MKTAAVICEYNPFHLGHAHQLKMMQMADTVICIMSGSFTQRGSASVLSKYERARLAVMGGADLVLELPFPFSAASGEFFAKGGVAIADGISSVDTLCFGSETADTEAIRKAAENARTEAFQSALAERVTMKRNASYRDLFAKVYCEMFGEDAVFSGSNDILGFLYVSALLKSSSEIRPLALLREGEDYNGTGAGLPSATSIRKMIVEKDLASLERAVPPTVFASLLSAMENGSVADHEKFFPLFASAVRAGLITQEEFFDVPRELASRILAAAKTARNFEDFLANVRTRHFSDSRIRRAMLMMFFGVTDADAKKVTYTSVLAANEKGRAFLSRVRKTSKLPILTKPADSKFLPEEARRAFALAARADSVWEMLSEKAREGNAMMREGPRMM